MKPQFVGILSIHVAVSRPLQIKASGSVCENFTHAVKNRYSVSSSLFRESSTVLEAGLNVVIIS